MRNTTIALSILSAVLACAGSETTQALMTQLEDADKTQPDSKAAACKSHKTPRSQCFICDPKLREKGRLWCKEHDRYEDRCWICHPEAQDKKRLFCKEHSLYEAECFLCHPELKRKQDKPSSGAASGAPQNATRGEEGDR